MRSADREAGSVTAETALALPAVTMVLAVLLASGSVVAAQLRCVDAARTGARLAARGESTSQVVAAAQHLAPAGGRVAVAVSGSTVTVTVTAAVRLPFEAGGLPVQAVAVTELEQP